MNNIIILLVVITVLVVIIFALLNLKYWKKEQQTYNELLKISKETLELDQSTLQQYKDFLEFIKEGEQNNSDRYIKILELMNDLTQIIPNQIVNLQNELNKEQNNKDNE
jgi:ABC-type dipeptide/oligopeptide/nickel transport system permease component